MNPNLASPDVSSRPARADRAAPVAHRASPFAASPLATPRSGLKLRVVAAAVAVLSLDALEARAQTAPEPPPPSTAEAAATAAGETAPADDAACDADCRNRRVAQGWSRESGQPAPDVATDAQGTKRLQWRGTLNLKTHANRVETSTINTPARDGTPVLATMRTELQLPHLDGTGTSDLQFAAQAGDDRAVMPDYRAQVQNLAASRQSEGWGFTLGDYAANVSQLGLQLGYRGLHAHHDVAGVKAAVFAGTIAESWDALANRSTASGQPARNRDLRDIAGLHLARNFGERIKAFAAVAAYRDQGASVEDALRQAPAVDGRSLAFGVQMNLAPWTLAVEWGHSRASQRALIPLASDPQALPDEHDAADVTQTQASALTVDASRRFDSGQLRVGARRIGSTFTAAAMSVQPGSDEFFVAGDWTPLTGLQLNGDVRRVAQRTAATSMSNASRSQGHRVQLGANANLGTWWPWAEGLAVNLQGSGGEQRGANSTGDNRQAQGSVGVTYAHRLANLGLTLTEGATRTPAYPQADSDTRGVQAQVAVPFGTAGEGGWSGQAALLATRQQQALVTQHATGRNDGYGITLQAGREGVAQFNLAIQQQVSHPPPGGARVRQQQVQLDAQRPLTKNVDLKASARWARHNLGAAANGGREQLFRLELLSRW